MIIRKSIGKSIGKSIINMAESIIKIIESITNTADSIKFYEYDRNYKKNIQSIINMTKYFCLLWCAIDVA